VHALLAQVAFKGSFIVSVGKDHIFGAGIHTIQTTDALIPIYVIGTLLVLKNALHWAYLDTITTLGTGPHLEDTRIREVRHYGQTRLLRVILLKTIKGAGQLTEPAPRTF